MSCGLLQAVNFANMMGTHEVCRKVHFDGQNANVLRTLGHAGRAEQGERTKQCSTSRDAANKAARLVSTQTLQICAPASYYQDSSSKSECAFRVCGRKRQTSLSDVEEANIATGYACAARAWHAPCSGRDQPLRWSNSDIVPRDTSANRPGPAG